MTDLRQVVLDTASFQLNHMNSAVAIINQGTAEDLHDLVLRLNSLQQLINRELKSAANIL